MQQILILLFRNVACVCQHFQLIRKVIIQIFVLLKNHDWNLNLTRKFVATVDAILNKEVLTGFTTHVLNVIKDELKNIMNGKASDKFYVFFTYFNMQQI